MHHGCGSGHGRLCSSLIFQLHARLVQQVSAHLSAACLWLPAVSHISQNEHRLWSLTDGEQEGWGDPGVRVLPNTLGCSQSHMWEGKRTVLVCAVWGWYRLQEGWKGHKDLKLMLSTQQLLMIFIRTQGQQSDGGHLFLSGALPAIMPNSRKEQTRIHRQPQNSHSLPSTPTAA